MPYKSILNPHVAVARCAEPRYPTEPPFHPDHAYPDYLFPAFTAREPNHAYAAVRQAFRLLRLDAAHAGTPAWNPLGEVIHPGDRVVVKPNYVIHTHFSDRTYDCVVTHSAVLRAVIDYALKAAGREGSVTVADAPLKEADFDEIVRRCRLDDLTAFYRQQGYDVRLLDMRYMKVVQRDGLVVGRQYNQAQMAASRVVDVGGMSAFRDIEPTMWRVAGADYERRTTRQHHSGGRHEYRISQHILDADAVLSVGKLKTHKKTGVTLSMKNLVGINVDKNFLPHYRIGMPCQGGDEYPDRPGWSQKARQWLIRAGIELLLVRAERFSVPLMRHLLAWLPRSTSDAHYAEHYTSPAHPGYTQKTIERFYSFALGSHIRDGNWSGNDTAWRMVMDLNTILLYSDAKGELGTTPARRYLSVLDGILGGAGEGPMNPTPVASGVILAGYNPLSVDWCAAQLMGLDPDALRVISGARQRPLPLGPDAPPVLLTDDPVWSQGLTPANSLRFQPHSCWPHVRAWH